MTTVKRKPRLTLLLGLIAGMAVAAGGASADQTYASHGMTHASPTEVYRRYVEVLATADSVEDIFPFSPIPDAKNRADLAAIPANQRKQALAAMRSMALTDLEVLSEKVDGDTATLEVSGQSPNMLDGKPEPTWGTITLVRRNGEWKVSNQALRDKPEPYEDR